MLIHQAGARKEQEQRKQSSRQGGAKQTADQVKAKIQQVHRLMHPEEDEVETTLEREPANNQYSLLDIQKVRGWGRVTCLVWQTSLTEALHRGTPKYHLQNGNDSSLKSMPFQMEAQSGQRREPRREGTEGETPQGEGKVLQAEEEGYFPTIYFSALEWSPKQTIEVRTTKE